MLYRFFQVQMRVSRNSNPLTICIFVSTFFSSFYFLSWKRKCNNYVFFYSLLYMVCRNNFHLLHFYRRYFIGARIWGRGIVWTTSFSRKKNTNIKDTSLQTNKEASMRQNNILSRIVYQSNHPTSFRSSISSWRQ